MDIDNSHFISSFKVAKQVFNHSPLWTSASPLFRQRRMNTKTLEHGIPLKNAKILRNGPIELSYGFDESTES